MNHQHKPNFRRGCHTGLSAGFTIAELIIYMTIFGILGVFAARVLNVSLIANTSVSRLNEVQLAAQRSLNQIVAAVHRAITIAGASTTLHLQMGDTAKDPTIFALSSGAITIQEGTSSITSLTPSSTYVTAFTLTKLTNPAPSTSSVKIVVTMGYNEGSDAASGTLYTLQTTAMPL